MGHFQFHIRQALEFPNMGTLKHLVEGRQPRGLVSRALCLAIMKL